MTRPGQNDLHGGWHPCSWHGSGFPKEPGPRPAMRKGTWLVAARLLWALPNPTARPAVPNGGAACESLFDSRVEACLLAWERLGEASIMGLGSAQNCGFQSLDMRTESGGLPVITPDSWLRNSSLSKAPEVGKGPVSLPIVPYTQGTIVSS